MKEWFWNLNCMWHSRKGITDNERHEYNWYRYLVLYDLNRWFDNLKFWKRKDSELPF